MGLYRPRMEKKVRMRSIWPKMGKNDGQARQDESL